MGATERRKRGRSMGGRAAEVVICPFGILAFDEEGGLAGYRRFSRDPALVARSLLSLMDGRPTRELVELVKDLSGEGYDAFIFESPALARGIAEELGVSTSVRTPLRAAELVRADLGGFAVKIGFSEPGEDIGAWVHQVNMELSRALMRRSLEKRDLVVAQAINMIDDIDRILNLMASRIREWYNVHFPELNRLVGEHERYIKLIKELGHRDNFTVDRLMGLGMPKEKARKIAEAAGRSLGAELRQEDLDRIRDVCAIALELYSMRRSLEHYIDSVMEEIAPNLKAVAGPLLGARLISLAGGLERLAKLPSSTVQVLGAEKALFRALRTGAKPPKHGVIFQHYYVKGAKRWQRGKVARALAGKISIAARIDAFSGRYVGDELKADLDARVKEIMEKYPSPPKKPVRAKPTRPRRVRKRGRRG